MNCLSLTGISEPELSSTGQGVDVSDKGCTGGSQWLKTFSCISLGFWGELGVEQNQL